MRMACSLRRGSGGGSNMKLINVTKLGGSILGLLLLLGVGVMSSTTAQAQYPYPNQDQYRRDRDRNNDRYRNRDYDPYRDRSEEHTSELQSHHDLVCRLLLEKKKKQQIKITSVI